MCSVFSFHFEKAQSSILIRINIFIVIIAYMHFHQVLTWKDTKNHRLVRNFYNKIITWWKWLWALVTMKTFEIGHKCSPLKLMKLVTNTFFVIIAKNCFLRKQCKDIFTAEKHYVCDYCLKIFFLSANFKKHSMHKNGSQKFFLKRKNTYWRETISLWSVS